MDSSQPESDPVLASVQDVREEIRGLLAARGGRGKLQKDENVVGEDLTACRVIETIVRSRTGVTLPARHIYAFALSHGDQRDAGSNNDESRYAIYDREWIRGYLYLNRTDFSKPDYPKGDDLKSLKAGDAIRPENLSCRQRWAATKVKRVLVSNSPIVEDRKITPEVRARIISRLCTDVEVLLGDDSALDRLTEPAQKRQSLHATAAVVSDPKPDPVKYKNRGHSDHPSMPKKLHPWQRIAQFDVYELGNKIGEGIVFAFFGLLTVLMWIAIICGIGFLLWFIINILIGIFQFITGLFLPH